jgi:hypothetical protein
VKRPQAPEIFQKPIAAIDMTGLPPRGSPNFDQTLIARYALEYASIRVVPTPQLRVENLGHVIGDQTDVVREISRLHLRHLPARQIPSRDGIADRTRWPVAPDRLIQEAVKYCVFSRIELRVKLKRSGAHLAMICLGSSSFPRLTIALNPFNQVNAVI